MTSTSETSPLSPSKKPFFQPRDWTFSSLFKSLKEIFSSSINYYIELCPKTTQGKTNLLYFGAGVIVISAAASIYFQYQQTVSENKILYCDSVITEKREAQRQLDKLPQAYEESLSLTSLPASSSVSASAPDSQAASSSSPPISKSKKQSPSFEQQLTQICLNVKTSFTRDIERNERKINTATAAKTFYTSFKRFSLLGFFTGLLVIGLPLARKIKSLQELKK